MTWQILQISVRLPKNYQYWLRSSTSMMKNDIVDLWKYFNNIFTLSTNVIWGCAGYAKCMQMNSMDLFSSSGLKAQVTFLIACFVVRPSVRPSVFFSRTTGPILTKLGTMHLWVKGIQIYINEGPSPFPRGDYYEIAKIHWRNSKFFSSRSRQPISTKLGTKQLELEGSSLFKWRATLFSTGRL